MAFYSWGTAPKRDDSALLTIQQLEELIFETLKVTKRRWGGESRCITGRLQKEEGEAERNCKKDRKRCEKELTKPRKGGRVHGEQSVTRHKSIYTVLAQQLEQP